MRKIDIKLLRRQIIDIHFTLVRVDQMTVTPENWLADETIEQIIAKLDLADTQIANLRSFILGE